MEENSSAKKVNELLLKKIEEFSQQMERLHLPEYVEYLHNPKRMLFVNFLVGMARGVGVGIGATVVAGLIIYLLSQMVTLPIVGKLIAEIIKIVQVYLHQ